MHIDYTGPIKSRYLIVVVDAYSKWLDAAIVPSANSANTIQSLRTMFSIHGLPEVIVSDNGSPFVSVEFKEFLAKNGIRHTTTPPYHPKSNGQMERAVQTLKKALKKSTDSSLQTQLSRFLLKYRITPHATTGIPPSELLMNRHVRTFSIPISQLKFNKNVRNRKIIMTNTPSSAILRKGKECM